jgi:hypothetical protein
MTLPPLPPELWTLVFRLVSDVPGALNTSPLLPLQTGDRSWNIPEGSIESSVKVKTRLGRVCKIWRHISIPLLYEIVHLHRRVHQIQSLVQALRLGSNILPSAGNPTNAPSVKKGSHIKRLDLDVTDWHKTDWEVCEREQLLSSLVFMCSNLQIFNYMRPIHVVHNHTRLHLKLHSSRIRHITFTERERPSNPAFGLVKVGPPTGQLPFDAPLEVLSANAGSDWWSEVGTQPISLPHLHTLLLDAFKEIPEERAIVMWDLSALRRLQIGDYSVGWNQYDFFKSHGPTLTSLDLGISEHFILQEILTLCPALLEISVLPWSMRQSPSSRPLSHPSLVMICLYFKHYLYRLQGHWRADMWMRDHTRAMENILQMTRPQLKFVRLLDFEPRSDFHDISSHFRPQHAEFMNKISKFGLMKACGSKTRMATC